MSDAIRRALAVAFSARRGRADGGATDDTDIASYERMRDEVRQQPDDIQQMTHLGDKPQRPITIHGGYIGDKTLGKTDYDVAGPLQTAAQTAYDFKTAPLYAFPPTAPYAGASDAAEGVISGDPVQAAMGVLGAPGRAGKAIAASAAAMAPADAHASFIGRAAKTADLRAFELAKRFVEGAPHAAARDGLADRDAWLFHGWGRDKAGNWKSEISDQSARIDPKAADAFRSFEPGVKVGDVLQHPPLYDAYPTSYSMKLNDVRSADPHVRGGYDLNNDTLHVNRKISSNDEMLDILLHELQHRHDMRFEGHQPGGSPELFPDHAAVAREELEKANAALGLLRFQSDNPHLPQADALDAFRRQWNDHQGELPTGWLGYLYKHGDGETLGRRQMELIDQINSAPKPFDQYQALVGEQMARLPGQRLKMDETERRHSFPLQMPNGIVQRQQGIVSPNHGDAAWSRARNGKSEGGSVVDEVHETVSHMAGGGSVVERAMQALGKLKAAGSGYHPVPGKPANVVIPGYGKVEARPIEPLASAADSYMAGLGRAGEHHVSAYPKFDEDLARRYAEAFDALGHNPNDPRVRRAYDALAEETMAQYRSVKDSGLDMRFLKDGERDPYAASPSLGYADIVNNGKLHVFPTDQGYGTSEAFNSPNSPMLKRVGRIGDLENATVNDAFRVVHDAFGHFGPGNPFFRAPGEERAFINHSRMYSPDALPAMASETRGQNSWVNYGPHAEHNAKASGADTIYADQKVDLMPDWATKIPDADGPGKAEGGALIAKALKKIMSAVDPASDAFKAWHGESAIPAERYFHGTSKDVDFPAFKTDRHGAWFTKDPVSASQYAIENDSKNLRYAPGGTFERVNDADRVIPTFLRADNPFTGDKPESVYMQNNYKKAQSDWFDQLRAQGHDAWVPESANGDLAVILGQPTQIKSAISNTGEFSPTDKRIDRADGGDVEAPEAPDATQDSPSLMDRAMSVLGNLNPIGSAEASPLDGVIQIARKAVSSGERGALGLIRKPGKPTVAMAEGAEPRFPGIYGDPREIAAEANSRVAPRSESLPTVFGVNRDELYEMGAGVKGNMEPQIALAKKPKGSAAVDGIMNKRNEQRLLDILEEGKKYPELQRGMDSWYEMYPLYQAFERIYGPEEGAKQFNMFNHSTGMMSPASEVTTEINRGTAAYALNKQGRFDDFVKFGGQPEFARGRSFPDDMRHVIAHPYHSTAQAGPLAKFYEKGFIDSKKPKVPLYVQASGVPATGFQTKMPVPDAHFTRALGMADTRWGTATPDKSMSMAELQAVAPWFRDKIASKSGLESVPAQARLWGLMSGQTGVTSPIGTPKLEMIADHIMDMARRHNMSPVDARDALIRGEKFAEGGDVEQGSI